MNLIKELNEAFEKYYAEEVRESIERVYLKPIDRSIMKNYMEIAFMRGALIRGEITSDVGPFMGGGTLAGNGSGS